jgi:hypothetical protein
MFILKADGSTEHHVIPNGSTIAEVLEAVRSMIGAEVLDSFTMVNGNVVWVDGLGHQKGLPENARATRYYRSICKPGTKHVIVGDVALVWSHEYSSE